MSLTSTVRDQFKKIKDLNQLINENNLQAESNHISVTQMIEAIGDKLTELKLTNINTDRRFDKLNQQLSKLDMRIEETQDKFNKDLNEWKGDLVFDMKKLDGKVRFMEA